MLLLQLGCGLGMCLPRAGTSHPWLSTLVGCLELNPTLAMTTAQAPPGLGDKQAAPFPVLASPLGGDGIVFLLLRVDNLSLPLSSA